MLTPKDVFTPGRPPLARAEVYAHRGQPERDFALAIERGLVPIVHGEFGVGKTSLARHALLSAERAGRLVNVESASGKSFVDVIKTILEHLGYEVTRSRTAHTVETSTTTAGGEAGLALVPLLSAKLTSQRARASSKGETLVRELAVGAPTDSKVLELCERARLVLIVDELHAASPELLADLTAFVKAASNKPCKHFRVVLLGTARDATRLVKHDPGVDRIIVEIALTTLSEAESRSLVEEGMRALAVEVPPAVLDRAARVTAGSPALVQWVALEMAELAVKRTPRRVEEDDLQRAVANYVRTKAKRLERAYTAAAESTGARRYRKQILLAMAQLDDELVTTEALVAQVSKQLGEQVTSTSLSAPLRALKSDEHGEIVRDVEGDARGRFTFRDPSMRPFLRMREAGEREGLFSEA
ncbi:MAG: ATP-binding protein [Polyangiaceae bacterium]